MEKQEKETQQWEKYELREQLSHENQETLRAYPELLRSILFYRGIDTDVKAHNFLNPNYDTHLHDPFLMKDMEKAVSRILLAIEKEQKILIYSDYDADGIPAAVILSDFFKKIKYKNVSVYIPHRHTEGYGVHKEAVELFKKDNVDLIITLDCGIVDCDEVELAQNLGIDVIVTDHHLPGEKLPKAFAILNSKQVDCLYPYKMLCGSGVAFKLVQALIIKMDEQGKVGFKPGHEKWLLDMAGLATLSDMVPLQDENRVLAHYGLKVLRKTPRPGLSKLFTKIKLERSYLTEDDVGFMITPRINAASRMGVPIEAYKLLSTDDEVEAGQLVNYLDLINNERKGLVASLVKEAKKIISERSDKEELKNVIVLGNPEWRPALLGLVANTLVEAYGKPVFLWGREEHSTSELKGSCRSDGSVNLVHLMDVAKESFQQYGGHSFSGGFSIILDKVHYLESYLSKAYDKVKSEGFHKEKIYIDARLSLDDVNSSTYSLIEKCAPFGMGNIKPLFIFQNIELLDVKPFGKEANHLELIFRNSRNQKIRAIGFFVTAEDFGNFLRKGNRINLIANLEKSFFRNIPELRLRIVDVI